MAEVAKHCHYCQQAKPRADLRPYGPGGAYVCFPCIKSSPEREQAAKNAFGALLDANEIPTGVTILTEDGPEPFTPPASTKAEAE